VAGLPLAVGLTGADYHRSGPLHSGFQAAMLICAGLLTAGAALAALTIDDSVLRPTEGNRCPSRPAAHAAQCRAPAGTR